ncbi:MAG: LysR family transcriptional regulator [Sphingomonas sp.]
MDKSSITLERMRSFVRVAERGSFSAVAREHGVGQSTITRHIAELEGALNATLLNRTTRRVTLTTEGERYFDDASAILRLVDEAADGVRVASDRLSGRIRVSSTGALGVRHVAKALFAFQDRHPDVVIDLALSDVRIDLVREAVDIAIRLGPLADSTMQRKAVGYSHRVLVASRAYLDQHGRPQRPQDLLQHQTIRMSNVEGSETVALHGPSGDVVSTPVSGRFLVDHGLAAREAVMQGRGIASAHLWLVDDLIASGAIERVLPDYAPEPVPLSILIVPGRARIKRVRVLIDALSDVLAGLPGMQRF